MTTSDSYEWPDQGDDAPDVLHEDEDGVRLSVEQYARFAEVLPAPYVPEDVGPGWLVRKTAGHPWCVYRLSHPPARRAWRTVDGTIVATDLTLCSALRAAYILRGKHAR